MQLILDLITGVFLLAGFLYGFHKGIIHSVLSLLGIIVGIAIAMQGSYLVSSFLQETFDLSGSALPIISFILVIIITVLVFRLIAFLLKKLLKALSLNFFNKIAGGAMWLVITLLLVSTMMWFADRNGFIDQELQIDSHSYRYCLFLAPTVLDYIGQVIPFFQDLFYQFDSLFEESFKTA